MPSIEFNELMWVPKEFKGNIQFCNMCVFVNSENHNDEMYCNKCGFVVVSKFVKKYNNPIEQLEYEEQKRYEMRETINFGSNCEVCNCFSKDKCTCEKTEREKQDYDIVEKPYHYNVGIEVDKFIDSWDMNYRQGNIIKYVTRYPYKDPTKKVQDLKKAKWYLERLIEKEEEKEKNVPTK